MISVARQLRGVVEKFFRGSRSVSKKSSVAVAIQLMVVLPREPQRGVTRERVCDAIGTSCRTFERALSHLRGIHFPIHRTKLGKEWVYFVGRIGVEFLEVIFTPGPEI